MAVVDRVKNMCLSFIKRTSWIKFENKFKYLLRYASHQRVFMDLCKMYQAQHEPEVDEIPAIQNGKPVKLFMDKRTFLFVYVHDENGEPIVIDRVFWDDLRELRFVDDTTVSLSGLGELKFESTFQMFRFAYNLSQNHTGFTYWDKYFVDDKEKSMMTFKVDYNNFRFPEPYWAF